jgi:flagellar hook-associated protein 3 FlgL
MRVTDSIGYQNLLRDIARVQERMQVAQAQVSSNKKVTKPSDDPSAAADIVRIFSEKSEAEQFERNITFAESKLNLADTVLDSVEHMVERARTLGQLSFGNPATASLYTTELDGLRDQIISASNTVHAGRFIFGGSITTTAPYVKASDSSVSYQGNSQETVLQVSRTSTLQTQIPGAQVFSGSVDIFEVMADLSTAMTAGDKDGIDTQVKQLEQFAEVISIARSKIGSFVNRASNMSAELTTERLARETDLSHEQAANMAQAITELNMSQNSLEATLAVGARISQLTILDFLK